MIDQKAIEGYASKLSMLVKCGLDVNYVLHEDIRPKNKDTPMNSAMWYGGANTGLLIFFLHILDDEERKINARVLERCKVNNGSGDEPLDLQQYIDTAVAVLRELGMDIPDM